MNADRGEIRVGGKYQAEVSSQSPVVDKPEGIRERALHRDHDAQSFLPLSIEEDGTASREELTWDANGGLTEKQIEQYLIVAR